MSLFERVMCRLFRTREIHKPEGLYLRRFYLSPRVKWLPFQVFLHHILLSDDRVMHDHPWSFWSFILKGCYRETYRCRCSGCRIKGWEPFLKQRIATPGTLLRNPAEHIHRVEIIRPVWSLVIAQRPRRVWGFWPEATNVTEKPSRPKFVPWREFLGERGADWPEDRV